MPVGINSFGKVELLSKLFNPLFLLQGADKQLSILLGNDIAIQALNYHLTFIGYMNHAVLAFIQSDAFIKLKFTCLIC